MIDSPVKDELDFSELSNGSILYHKYNIKFVFNDDIEFKKLGGCTIIHMNHYIFIGNNKCIWITDSVDKPKESELSKHVFKQMMEYLSIDFVPLKEPHRFGFTSDEDYAKFKLFCSTWFIYE